MVLSILDDSFHIASSHELSDLVGLSLMFTEVKDCDDVEVRTQTAHGLGLAGDSGASYLVEALGLSVLMRAKTTSLSRSPSWARYASFRAAAQLCRYPA